MSDATPRWRYRLANYRSALALLREAMDQRSESGLNQLETEGTIRRFKFTAKLAWNVMKDYLEHEGVVFDQVTPRAIIRKAYEVNLIEHGEAWMDALDARNKMSHTYDARVFEQVVGEIANRYLAVMEDVCRFLTAKEAADG